MAEASAPSLLDRYVAAVLRHRWPVVALATLLMLAMTAGAPSITVTNDYRILFSDDNPQLIAYNALENTYAVSNRALIAVAPRDGSVFTQETLGSIVELTDAAWQAPYSSRVDSLTNYSHSEAFGEDDLIVAPLVEDASGLSDADLARIEAIALDASDIAGRLISYDGRVAGVAINFVLPENPDLAVIEITDYLNAVLDEARASHPGIDYHTTGDVVMNRTFSDATQSDIQTLTPIVFLIIVVATVVLLRSVFATVAVVAVLMFAINTTMGFAGWRGVVFSPTNARRADHRHGGGGRGFHPYRHDRPAGDAARAGQARRDRRIVSGECLSDLPDLPDDRDRVSQPERLRLPAVPCPGKLRGVRRGRRLRLHHDAPAGAAGAPAAAPAARPGCRARVLRPLLRPFRRLCHRPAHAAALVHDGGGGGADDRHSAHRVERQHDAVLR